METEDASSNSDNSHNQTNGVGQSTRDPSTGAAAAVDSHNSEGESDSVDAKFMSFLEPEGDATQRKRRLILDVMRDSTSTPQNKNLRISSIMMGGRDFGTKSIPVPPPAPPNPAAENTQAIQKLKQAWDFFLADPHKPHNQYAFEICGIELDCSKVEFLLNQWKILLQARSRGEPQLTVKQIGLASCTFRSEDAVDLFLNYLESLGEKELEELHLDNKEQRERMGSNKCVIASWYIRALISIEKGYL